MDLAMAGQCTFKLLSTILCQDACSNLFGLLGLLGLDLQVSTYVLHINHPGWADDRHFTVLVYITFTIYTGALAYISIARM